jgi:hypothetical protein
LSVWRRLTSKTFTAVLRVWVCLLSPGCTYFFLKILSLLLFLAEESRHFSIDLIVTLFLCHSSETMFHLWLLFYPEIQFHSRLNVREVEDKCVISKTTVHEILVQELHMNRICARWVPRMLSEENMTNRTEASRQFHLHPAFIE